MKQTQDSSHQARNPSPSIHDGVLKYGGHYELDAGTARVSTARTTRPICTIQLTPSTSIMRPPAPPPIPSASLRLPLRSPGTRPSSTTSGTRLRTPTPLSGHSRAPPRAPTPIICSAGRATRSSVPWTSRSVSMMDAALSRSRPCLRPISALSKTLSRIILMAVGLLFSPFHFSL